MLEYLIVACIVGAASIYIGRYIWRMTRGKATGCGCGASGDACPKSATPPSSQTGA